MEKAGTWISDLLPHLSKVADDLCIVKSMHTEAINHDPAITFFQTGNQQPGRPSIGSWFSYGLGSENEDLPAFVVLLSKNSFYQAQPIYSRLWGSGFLPSNHQGVKLRSQGDPVLYLNDPAGNDPNGRRKSLDALAELNRIREREIGDPEIRTRIAAYEMAYRMQTSVPELADLSTESESTFKLYGEEAKIPGTHAANCLMARRLAERNVRFIFRSSTGDGTHHSKPRQAYPGAQQRNRSRHRSVDYRFKATRIARRHTCHLGRRIWSNRLFTRWDWKLRTGSSSTMLLSLFCRRWRQRWYVLRIDRRFLLQHRRESRSRT